MTDKDLGNDKQSNNPEKNLESTKPLSRRFFLSKGIASASTWLAVAGGSSVLAKAVQPSKLNAGLLKSEFKFKGEVLTPANGNFYNVAYGGLWNKLHPERVPQIIACAMDEQDVVAAVKFARANKLKVSIRGGGHNWCAPSLRNSGLLIDLTNLNKVISIDPVARKAVVQPIISNREIQAHLKPHNLAYPSGHCPPVKLSGYLLSGGMAWNQGVWGTGMGSG